MLLLFIFIHVKLTICGVLIAAVEFVHHSAATCAPWSCYSHFRYKLVQILYINTKKCLASASQECSPVKHICIHSCGFTFTFIQRNAVISIGIHALGNFALRTHWRIYPCGFHIGFKIVSHENSPHFPIKAAWLGSYLYLCFMHHWHWTYFAHRISQKIC